MIQGTLKGIFQPTLSNSEWEFSFFLIFEVGNMVKKQKMAEKKLNDYIWSLQGQCDSIVEINRGLISQYCRFYLMAEDISIKIKKEFDDGKYDNIENDTKLYEKFNKLALQLYKTLKFDSIKDELAKYGNNPFTKLVKEAEQDDDL